eukprot:UN13705
MVLPKTNNSKIRTNTSIFTQNFRRNFLKT